MVKTPILQYRHDIRALICFAVGLFLCFTGTVMALQAQQPAGTTEEYFDSKGVRIHYVISGAGDPLVLIHGFAGSAANMGSIQRELARDFRVIALDCRGHGKSDKPHDPAQYGRQMSEDIVRLLDHLELSTAHVVGHSHMGVISQPAEFLEHVRKFLQIH